MLRFVKWEFSDMENSQLVLFNRITLFKGKWKGFMFNIQGTGLSKCEKEFGLKRSESHYTIYFLKWGVTLNRKGYDYKHSLKYVDIVKDEVLI